MSGTPEASLTESGPSGDQGNVFQRLFSPPLLKALEERGFSTPTHPQMKLVPLVAGGHNALLMAPTGTGKTEAAPGPVPAVRGVPRQQVMGDHPPLAARPQHEEDPVQHQPVAVLAGHPASRLVTHRHERLDRRPDRIGQVRWITWAGIPASFAVAHTARSWRECPSPPPQARRAVINPGCHIACQLKYPTVT